MHHGQRLRRRAMLALLLPMPAAANGFSPEQRAEIVAILRDALRTDPTLLRDAQAALAAAALAERKAANAAAIAAAGPLLFGNQADPVLGDPQAIRAIVEFADPRCGFCKQLHLTRQALLRRRGDVRVISKELAVLGPLSVYAATALLAAHRQARYAAFHDALYRLREEPSEPVLQRQAERVGLDWAQLRRDMGDPVLARQLDQNRRLAQALGIEGTPAMVVGDTLLEGNVSLAELEQAVDAVRVR